MTNQGMPTATKLYVAFQTIAGLAAALLASRFILYSPIDITMGIYFLIAVVTARMTVKIPYTEVHFSLDTPFIFVILISYGIFPALLADAAGKLVTSIPFVKSNWLVKVPFNLSSGVLSAFGAGLIFHWLIFGHTGSEAYILPIMGMTVAYYVINTITVATVICITQKQNLIVFWFKNFLPTGVGFLASGSIATLIFILHQTAGYLSLVVMLPLLGLIYYSQKVYLNKELDAKQHISDLESLYLSTIKSLSLALDAKDEYTHGHVHRVRSYAVGLAKLLGIEDEAQLQGIGFAGLTHDIGKIAIPDAILNKPGKYTEAEMNRMKIHPIVSAEILKSIPLPFPVAKIVRHHHEKWNGDGYPDGLSTKHIPLESRILAVADVYDAIRSDRPYRPKMELDRAVKIMKSERGVTLDEEMVDVFIENLDQLEKAVDEDAAAIEDNSVHNLVKTSLLAGGMEAKESETAIMKLESEKEPILIAGLMSLFSKGETLDDLLAGLAAVVSQLVPYNAFVVYLADLGDKTLDPAYVNGRDTEFLQTNRIETGQGASGWVHLNLTPMIGTPPKSEFPSLPTSPVPYKSVLSVPLISLNQPVGAVTLYSESTDAFSAEDQHLLLRMGPILGPLIKSALPLAIPLDQPEDRQNNVLPLTVKEK